MKTELLRLVDVSARDERSMLVESIDFLVCRNTIVHVISADDMARRLFFNLITCQIAPLSGRRIIADGCQEANFGYIANNHRLFEDMTVADNLLFMCPTKGFFTGSRFRARQRAADILARYQLDIAPETTVRQLDGAQKCLLEIVKAMEIYHAQILVVNNFQEIPAKSVPEIYALLRQCCAKGNAVILSTTARLAVNIPTDTTVLLQHGRPIRTLFSTNRTVEKYYGDEMLPQLGRIYGKAPDATNTNAVDRFVVRYRFRDRESSFYVCSGQILGLLSESGIDDNDIIALLQSDRISIEVNGAPFARGDLVSLVRRRIGFFPLYFERLILPSMSVKDNLELMVYDNLCRVPSILSPKLEKFFSRNCVSLEHDDMQRAHTRKIHSSLALQIVADRFAQKRWRGLVVHTSAYVPDSPEYRILKRFITEQAMRGTAMVLVSSDKHWLERFCSATIHADHLHATAPETIL